MKKVALIALAVMMGFSAVAVAADEAIAPVADVAAAVVAEVVAADNAACPVCGTAIDEANKAVAAFEGKEYNVCPGCVDAFNADAANLVAAVAAEAAVVEEVPAQQ